MMRSKKKRQQQGKPEPGPHHCIACGRLRKDALPFPAVTPDGKPFLDANGKRINQIGEINIDVFSTLDVNVKDFPIDHGVSMMVLCNALMKVSEYFLMLAQKAKQSPIQIAKPGMSLADIEKMMRNN